MGLELYTKTISTSSMSASCLNLTSPRESLLSTVILTAHMDEINLSIMKSPYSLGLFMKWRYSLTVNGPNSESTLPYSILMASTTSSKSSSLYSKKCAIAWCLTYLAAYILSQLLCSSIWRLLLIELYKQSPSFGT